jgi:cellulose synthase/poly-beta-1,6-N-acetylglucosamine synthase-like glycosyltransferase
MIPEIIFWLSVFAIFHSYLLFPLLVTFLARGKKENIDIYHPEEELPFISIIMSVHNEDKVILNKLKSIYNTLYPLNRFEVLIGSDSSSDGTNQICKIFSENYESLKFFPFPERQGKPETNNRLVEFAKGDILIMTDAQAFFEPATIYELVKHFRNPTIDVVGGNIINEKVSFKGISFQEKAYMTREIKMKYLEGLIWGKTMGIYGAIYAIRKEAYSKVPDNFKVDDFYLTMKVLGKKRKVIINLKALTKEDVPNDLGVEFRRKIRISSGNFQNMKIFLKYLFPPWSSLAFIFFSHKVLRWLGPFFLILILVTNIILAFSSVFYRTLLFVQAFLLILPLIDLILRKINLHSIFLRFITHFYAMNIALFIGFFKIILGKKSNFWQPTRR